MLYTSQGVPAVVNVQSNGNLPTYLSTCIPLDGGGGSNTLVGPNAASTWTISGTNTGTLGSVAFANVQNLVGGIANDTFAFQTGGNLAGTLDGSSGVNALDYFGYQGDITVDLALNLASQVNQLAPRSVLNVQNVTGSQGNDILVGDGNMNVLRGGTGRNLIIGGQGDDQLFGGGKDNILIGGYTSYDLNLVALRAVMKEWTSADSYAARITAISNGVVGSDGKRYALVGGKGKAATVFDDGTGDTLTGTANSDPNVLDWLFAAANDLTVNTKKKDTIMQIF